jgi:hypothetical protein
MSGSYACSYSDREADVAAIQSRVYAAQAEGSGHEDRWAFTAGMLARRTAAPAKTSVSARKTTEPLAEVAQSNADRRAAQSASIAARRMFRA